MDLEQQGKEIRQKLLDLSQEIVSIIPDEDKMIEFQQYCASQAVHQIDHTRTKDTTSFKEQLSSIHEWSINLSIFALSMSVISKSIEDEVNKEGSHFSTGYGTWYTPIESVRKSLNEACSTHFSRLKKKIHIIDSLKLLYKEIVEIKLPDTKDSILTDIKILNSVKLFFKNQCMVNFIFCDSIIFEQCEKYYQEILSTENK